jgi:methylmalonyl-CoA mutase
MGGMTQAVGSGWAKLKIEAAAAQKQARIDSGKDVIVGVNKYQSGIEDQVEAREIDNTAVREQQIARLAEIRASRDQEAVGAALAELGVAAYEGHGNLLELAVRATRLRATVGEISDALEQAWGRHRAASQTVSGVYSAGLADDENWSLLRGSGALRGGAGPPSAHHGRQAGAGWP